METSRVFSMPPGFGFHPTDVELISHYLKRKILGCQIDLEVIPEVDIYKYEPWDLPAKSLIPTRDSKWHFFTSRDKKYPNGSRSNRATAAGYWKSTGKDRNIRLNNQIIGTKKTLVFHQGRPPYGKRTEWIMHEYYLNEKQYSGAPIEDIFVLCRVTKRNGLNQEEEELVSPQVKKCINPRLSLPKKSCPKDFEDIFVHLIPKKEASSPTEEVDNYESWLEELYDPNICTSLLLSEPVNEQKVGGDSLALKNDSDQKCVHDIDETNVSLPEDHDSHNFLGWNSDPHEFDYELLFGQSGPVPFDAICGYQIGSEIGDGYIPYPDYEDRCAEGALLTGLFDPCAVFLSSHGGMISEGCEEGVATFTNGSPDTGIQIRERQDRPCEALSQRIRFQVHNSTKSGPVDQTFVFVSEAGRLDSTCELVIRDSAAPKTKVIRGRVQGKPTSENTTPSVLLPPRGPPSSSSLSHRKLLKPGRRTRLLHKSRDCLRKARGFVRNIGFSLRRFSLVGLNSLIVVVGMLGAAMLIAFFLVMNALRFLCPSCL